MSKPTQPSELSHRGRADYYYRRRFEKYTFDDDERKLLLEILNAIKPPPHDPSQRSLYNNYRFKPKQLIPNPQTGYQDLIEHIKMKLNDIRRSNEENKTKGINKYLPKFLVQINTSKLETALEYVKYHHYALTQLNQPYVAFNRAKGKNDEIKQFEMNPDLTARQNNPFIYSAKNTGVYLRKHSFSIFGISFGSVGNLYNAFQNKLSRTKETLTQVYSKQDKTTLRQDLQSNYKFLFPPQNHTLESIDAYTPGMVTHAEILEYANSLTGPLTNNMMKAIIDLVSWGNDENIRTNPLKKRNAFVIEADRRIHKLEEIKQIAQQIILTSIASDSSGDKVFAETIINEATVDQNALRALVLKFSTLMKSSDNENDYGLDYSELHNVVPTPSRLSLRKEKQTKRKPPTGAVPTPFRLPDVGSGSGSGSGFESDSDSDADVGSSIISSPLSIASSSQHSP